MARNGFKIWTDQFLFTNEGGYGNDARDPGGETNRGITWITYKTLGAKVFGMKASREHWLNITVEDAKTFALYYWRLFYGDEINDDRLSVLVVYAYWASLVKGNDLIGNMQAWIKSNTAKKIDVDYVIGPETVRVINSLSPSQTQQLAEYALKISTQQFKNDPNYEYFRGWDKIISFLEEVVNAGKKL